MADEGGPRRLSTGRGRGEEPGGSRGSPIESLGPRCERLQPAEFGDILVTVGAEHRGESITGHDPAAAAQPLLQVGRLDAERAENLHPHQERLLEPLGKGRG